jgi:Trp operon repressor
MSQVSRRKLSKNVESRIYELFLDALLQAKTQERINHLIGDVLTPTEQIMLPKRLTIAYLLMKGYDQRRIGNLLKVGLGTVNRVSNILKTKGAGYTFVFNSIQRKEHSAEIFESINEMIGKVLGPTAPGRPNYKLWHARKMKQKIESRKPF